MTSDLWIWSSVASGPHGETRPTGRLTAALRNVRVRVNSCCVGRWRWFWDPRDDEVGAGTATCEGGGAEAHVLHAGPSARPPLAQEAERLGWEPQGRWYHSVATTNTVFTRRGPASWLAVPQHGDRDPPGVGGTHLGPAGPSWGRRDPPGAGGTLLGRAGPTRGRVRVPAGASAS